jgi:SRSO17 transposase
MRTDGRAICAKIVGGSDAVVAIDDTAIAKKGTHSVGVAAQYASALGKTANARPWYRSHWHAAKFRWC